MVKGVQMCVRVSPQERELITAHGGLRGLISKFLANSSLEEESRVAEIKKLQVKIAEAQAQINQHTEFIEKLRAQREHNENPSKSLPPERELILFKKLRVAPKLSSPKEWEASRKILYLLKFAESGKLSAADEQTIMKHMNLHPPETAVGWLYSPTPEKMSLEALEKCRVSEPLGLLSLKREGKINEHLYKLLMMWLSLSKENVDDWILRGFPPAAEAKG